MGQSWVPPIPERLVAVLAEQFPDQAADLEWNDREVWFRAGQASVVRWLHAKLEEQLSGGIDTELG
jgi:hypothetical protein